MDHVAAVLIDSSADRVFDYRVPPSLAARIAPGMRVRVPLRQRAATGTVMDVRDLREAALPAGVELKPILGLLDEAPLLTPKLFELARWIADYYLAPMEAILRAMAPPAVRPEENKGKVRRTARLAKIVPEEEIEALRRRAPRQAALVRALSADEAIPVADLGDGAAVSASLKALAGRGWVVFGEEEVARDPWEGEEIVATEAPPLTEEQSAAVGRITGLLAEAAPRPVLLHGVTGSGKTEVYLQLIAQMLEAGRGAIVLVPEIALTPQTVERFKGRFDARGIGVAVLHSQLSEGERHDEWRRIRKGEARVVIGPRSAVFAPVGNLGIIIVDEEHEASYKQDSVPRYHGRDVAVVRAHLEGCGVVLGSATPSFESFRNTRSGKYTLVSMTRRIDHRQLPLIRVVDMRVEARKMKGVAILSDPLRRGLDDRLAKGEQSILFLNRRGFSRTLQCPGCGHLCTCNHCSVALTYHKSEDRLVCHVCGFRQRVPNKCPSCGDPGILMTGYGTQKVEEVLGKVFPKARVARLDSDNTQRKHHLRETLRAFRTGKIDILVGTQMIAKGLDFPNVTLVGVLNADVSLNMPDFRAGERTFQLLTQVAGRAGRGDVSGEVVIQTYAPHSPAIQHARRHDFEGFLAQEMEFRDAFRYPPESHVVLITARCQDAALAEGALLDLHGRLKRLLPESASMGEPVASPLAKAQDHFRFQLMLRSPSVRLLCARLREAMRDWKPGKNVGIGVDVDSYQLG